MSNMIIFNVCTRQQSFNQKSTYSKVTEQDLNNHSNLAEQQKNHQAINQNKKIESQNEHMIKNWRKNYHL